MCVIASDYMSSLIALCVLSQLGPVVYQEKGANKYGGVKLPLMASIKFNNTMKAHCVEIKTFNMSNPLVRLLVQK